MIAVNIKFKKNDIADFTKQMNRLIDDLGVAPKEAVRMGSIALLKAMQASTRRSRRTRKVTASRTARNRRVNGLRVFKATGYFGGREATRSIFAESLAEAKKSPLARIRYSGLAKASWGWSMRRLFPNASAPRVDFNEPRGAVAVSQTGTGRDYTITIENNLDYISKAFSSGRGPAVATAMRRAANTMRGRIEQRLKGRKL